VSGQTPPVAAQLGALSPLCFSPNLNLLRHYELDLSSKDPCPDPVLYEAAYQYPPLLEHVKGSLSALGKLRGCLGSFPGGFGPQWVIHSGFEFSMSESITVLQRPLVRHSTSPVNEARWLDKYWVSA
jgi:hypothetical protein